VFENFSISPLLTLLSIILTSRIVSAHHVFPTRLRSSVFAFPSGSSRYGKRKYDPSGRVEGDYNGMGQSDSLRIEISRVQKEEMELRKQRRLLEEEEAKNRK
jgi:hypothetical protein